VILWASDRQLIGEMQAPGNLLPRLLEGIAHSATGSPPRLAIPINGEQRTLEVSEVHSDYGPMTILTVK